MKPGDVIEWVYKRSQRVVYENEKLYSLTMKRWIPINERSLLISVTDEVYSWVNSKGLFHARRDDHAGDSIDGGSSCVAPRTV